MENIYKNKLISGLIFLSITPFLFLFTKADFVGGIIPAFASISGLIGATMMIWQLALGNRFIIALISADYETRIRLHKFLGIYGTLLVFAHPLLQTYTYGSAIILTLIPDLTIPFNQYVFLGKLAFSLFLIIWITSALLRKKMAYRLWLYIHYLTYVMIFLVLIHSSFVGIFINAFPLLKDYWLLLTAIFMGLIVWRMAIVFNIGKPKYKLKSKVNGAGEISLYTFKPLGKRIVPKVGQFFYIKHTFLGEARPFTVAEFNEKTGELTFGVKAVGRFTRGLENLKVNDLVFIDGPYGLFTNEAQNTNPKVIIAGGIGITPFIELVRRFGGQETYMFYANRELKEAVYRAEFQKELKANYTDIISQEKVQKPIVSGHITKEVLISKMGKGFIKSAKFFVCGSPGFMAAVKAILKELNVKENDIYFEDFGF